MLSSLHMHCSSQAEAEQLEWDGAMAALPALDPSQNRTPQVSLEVQNRPIVIEGKPQTVPKETTGGLKHKPPFRESVKGNI